MITEALILAYYKWYFKIIVKTDFSNYVKGKNFFQLEKDKLLHLVAFFSKNLNPAENNYEIYDKKLLAII